MAAPLHRHRSSLEGIIVPRHQPLKPEDYNKANILFDSITTQFEPSQATDKAYKPITLIRLVKEEVADKDDFLDLFFSFVKHDLYGDSEGRERRERRELNFAQILLSLEDFAVWTADKKNTLGESVTTFARYLMDNFFLPRTLLNTYLKCIILTLFSQSTGCKDSSTHAGIPFSCSTIRTGYWYSTTRLQPAKRLSGA